MNAYTVLLYYKYTSISDPLALQAIQMELCTNLDIKGRILLGSEGINGTVSGLTENIQTYIEETESYPELGQIAWKKSTADSHVFPRTRVNIRDEIVTLGLKKADRDVSLDKKAEYIEPLELKQLYESGEEFVIIDARNNYESRIGKFKNAITPDIRNFRDFPAFVDSIKHLKDKPVVTYCTGGIRCEKASAYLIQQGFSKVRQLHGGIHTYGEQAQGKNFEGECFVFDQRLHVPVNQANPTVVSSCCYCQQPITRYVDCTSSWCGNLFIACPNCQEQTQTKCPECYQGKA